MNSIIIETFDGIRKHNARQIFGILLLFIVIDLCIDIFQLYMEWMDIVDSGQLIVDSEIDNYNYNYNCNIVLDFLCSEFSDFCMCKFCFFVNFNSGKLVLVNFFGVVDVFGVFGKFGEVNSP